MTTSIFPLILAITTFVTLAKNVGSTHINGSDDIISTFKCSSHKSYDGLVPASQYLEQLVVIPKGTNSLFVTLPKFNPEKPVAFVCIDIADFDAEKTNVLYSITKHNLVTVLITLNEEAKEDIFIDVRVLFASNHKS